MTWNLSIVSFCYIITQTVFTWVNFMQYPNADSFWNTLLVKLLFPQLLV